MSSVAGPSRIIPTVPRRWEGTVSAPIDEEDAEVFLSSFAAILDPHFLPAKRHFHLLLYLALSSTSDPSLAEASLRLLGHIFSLYPPSALSDLVPSISREKDGLPPWFRRDEERQGRLDKAARKFLRPAIKDGIWALLWADDPERGAATADMEDVDEGGGTTTPAKRVGMMSENGWRVMALLVKLWEKDREEHSAACDGQDWSPMFLAQLPHPYASGSIQQDDASPVLSLIRSYLQHEHAVGVRARRNKVIAEGVLKLLIDTAQHTSPPSPFHAPSLVLSLVSSCRPLPLAQLEAFHTLVPPAHPLLPHLMAMEIEDRAGVRAERTAQRKRPEMLDRDFQVDWTPASGSEKESGDSAKGTKHEAAERRTNFPPPRPEYLSKLLVLPLMPESTDEDADRRGKMRWIKQSLALWCLANLSSSPGWEFARDESWRKDYRRLWAEEQDEARAEDAERFMDILAGCIGSEPHSPSGNVES